MKRKDNQKHPACIFGKLLSKKLEMITELNAIKAEEKFIEGSCGWEGYTGCKNPDERRAYSENIEALISELLAAIMENKTGSYIENIIDTYNSKAEMLEEEFQADTDETEMRCMYFERVSNICGLK
ncbi:MAG TPA: DUF4844 domain-containing protein [Chitinophagales bacterium]|nr:DUF4844 domain-containing protein [Chitinophagales bacterium]